MLRTSVFRRTLRAVAVVVALLALLSACGESSNNSTSAAPTGSGGGSGTKLRIGYSAWPGWFPLAVADAQGLFAKNGLDVELTYFADYTASIDALAAGQIDVNTQTLNDTIASVAAGSELKIVVANDNSTGNDQIICDQSIKSVADLKGKTIGVAGGPVDKSYVVLQAYYNSLTGGKLADDASVKFGAPPLINQLLSSGQVQAALNNWNWNATAAVDGKVQLISVAKMLAELGVPSQPPLLGWVFTDKTATDKKADIKAFLDASFAAKDALLHRNDVWEKLKETMGAKDNPALFAALRDGYRAGIVQSYDPTNTDAEKATFALLVKYGGADVTGGATALSDDTFWKGYRK